VNINHVDTIPSKANGHHNTRHIKKLNKAQSQIQAQIQHDTLSTICSKLSTLILLEAFRAMLSLGKSSYFTNKGRIILIPKSRDQSKIEN